MLYRSITDKGKRDDMRTDFVCKAAVKLASLSYVSFLWQVLPQLTFFPQWATSFNDVSIKGKVAVHFWYLFRNGFKIIKKLALQWWDQAILRNRIKLYSRQLFFVKLYPHNEFFLKTIEGLAWADWNFLWALFYFFVKS